MKRALLALVALAALIPFGIGASSATFVAASSNPNATFSTAADFNTVAVTLTDPGTPLRATVALTATAASDRGLASMTFQSSPAGANTWTNLCVDNVAPYTCDFDTLSVADGLRDLRAVALDTAGYSRESVVSARRIDNTAPATTLTDPGSPLTGHRDSERHRHRRRLRRGLDRAPVPARLRLVDDDLRVDLVQLRDRLARRRRV